MPPIYINTPGSGLDSAGKGLAAAQQYRGNEQKMDLQKQSFELETEMAAHKMDLEDQEFEIGAQQLEDRQWAQAEALMQSAKLAGVPGEEAAALRRSFGMVSESTANALIRQYSRKQADAATAAQQQEVQELLKRAPNVAAEVADGTRSTTDLGALKRAARKEIAQITEAEHTEQVRANMVESYDTWMKDAQFNMPGRDEEGYGDVMSLLDEFRFEETKPGTDYTLLYNQLTLLTNRSMREAAIALVKRDIGKAEELSSGMLRHGTDEADEIEAVREFERTQHEQSTGKGKKDEQPVSSGTPTRQALGGAKDRPAAGAATKPAQSGKPGEGINKSIFSGQPDDTQAAIAASLNAAGLSANPPPKGTAKRKVWDLAVAAAIRKANSDKLSKPAASGAQ